MKLSESVLHEAVLTARKRVAAWCDAHAFDYESLAVEHIACCNLCGWQSWDIIAIEDRYGLPARSLMCMHCGLIQTSPRMSAESYAEFYATGAYRKIASAFYNKSIEEEIPGVQSRYANALITYFGDSLEELSGGTMLDIGGSIGGISAPLAKTYGLRTTLLEPSIGEADQVPDSISVESGMIETWDAGGRLFDVVLLIQTIDHLLDVAGSLAKIRTLLAPGGIFIVDVVDVRGIAYGNQCMISALKIDHCYGLTQHTANAYLQRAGLIPSQTYGSDDRRKVLWLCKAGEPKLDAMPDRRSVWEMHSMLLADYKHQVTA